MSDNAYRLDPAALRRGFGRASAGYDAFAVLQREIQRRLLERLTLVRLRPRRIAELGCATGDLAWQLLDRYPQAQVLGLDFAEPMLVQAAAKRRGLKAALSAAKRRGLKAALSAAKRRGLKALLSAARPQWIAADAAALPLADASCELLIANLLLPCCPEPDAVLAEMRRVLAPNGLLMISSLGPDTLIELRRSWAVADPHGLHVHAFSDMHDVGDALLRAGFADPVMDVEHITLSYPTLTRLCDDLRGCGAVNALAARRRGLLGRRRRRTLEQAYERLRNRVDGRLPATAEIVYGHAWAAEIRTRAPARDDGAVPVSLARLRRRSS